MLRQKKGLSPVVATVLLITLVFAIALIVFLWARGFVKERVQKFVGGELKDSNEVCSEIKFKAEISGGGNDAISIINYGNVPIYGVYVKLIGGGKSERKYKFLNLAPGMGDIIKEGEPPVNPELDEGFEGVDFSSYEKILVIPQILGQRGEGNQAYTCDEIYGVEV